MLLDLIELASNTTLAYDAQTQERLQRLRGKTMTLHIKTIDQSLSFTPQAQGLELSRTQPEHVDVTLKTTLGAILKISRDGVDKAELQTGELEMIGDPIVGQRFAQLIADLDIDWQSLLSERIGTGPTQVVLTAVEQARNFGQESQSLVKTFATRLINDELDIVASADEVDSFLDEVDSLRADTERLYRQLKKLQNK